MLEFGGPLIQYDWYPFRERRRDTEILPEGRQHVKKQTQQKECLVMAEFGVMGLQTKEYPGFPAT